MSKAEFMEYAKMRLAVKKHKDLAKKKQIETESASYAYDNMERVRRRVNHIRHH